MQILIQEAQTFAIRRTVHHKPHRNMGNLRPIWGSPNNLCLLVASTVVIVRLSSFMSWKRALWPQIRCESTEIRVEIYQDGIKKL